MLLQEIISGLSLGCIYALVGFGFVLVYNAVGAVNFAHGEMVMLGGYFGYAFSQTAGLPLGAALLLSIGAMALLGAVYSRIAYYPMRQRPVVTVIIASIGMSILMRNSALALWGPDPLKLASFVGDGVVTLGPAVMPRHQLLIFAVTAAVFTGQSVFFSRTYLGRQMQATAQDQEAAQLMGIRVRHMITLTFVIAAALAGLAGFLTAPLWFLQPEVGLVMILKAFIAIVIGGFGSIPGLVFGGLFLGVTEVLTAAHLSSAYRDVIAYAILIFVLVFLPQGFFGEKISQKV